MDDGHLNSDTQKARQKSRRDIVLESMDVAEDAIIGFVKNPFAQPKYLTACGGLLVLIGTMFPWTYAGGLVPPGEPHSQDYIGFTTIPWKIVAGLGLVIILLAIFRRTKPGKANLPAASALALMSILFGCFLAYFTVCMDCAHLQPGLGNMLSFFALVLTFIFGLIPNPRQTVRE